MVYEVILTDFAKGQFDQIIHYILYRFGNEQAAQNILQDAVETKTRLSLITGSLKLCDDPGLRALGYHTIHFKRHHYIMVYRIKHDKVYVDGIYHDLQDYENILQ